MKRLALTFVALLLFSFIALESRANAKEQWTRVRSENFTLVGNANERDIREVAVKLEQHPQHSCTPLQGNADSSECSNHRHRL